jgi:hypothetical protein
VFKRALAVIAAVAAATAKAPAAAAAMQAAVAATQAMAAKAPATVAKTQAAVAKASAVVAATQAAMAKASAAAAAMQAAVAKTYFSRVYTIATAGLPSFQTTNIRLFVVEVLCFTNCMSVSKLMLTSFFQQIDL